VRKDRLREERIGFVRQQQAKTAEEAGFEVSENEKSRIIHILQPSDPRYNANPTQSRPVERPFKAAIPAFEPASS
jgi:hypothetical protein